MPPVVPSGADRESPTRTVPAFALLCGELRIVGGIIGSVAEKQNKLDRRGTLVDIPIEPYDRLSTEVRERLRWALVAD